MSKDLEMSLLIDFYGDILTNKQKELLEYYYNNDLSLSEIAENENITRQGVHDSIKRGEAILLELEQKLELVKKFKMLTSDMDVIQQCAASILTENQEFCYSAKINQNALKILDTAKHINF